jgi:K+-transporting ATPase KdpF subunit
MLGVGPGHRVLIGGDMFEYAVAGIAALLAFAYLAYALLNPERF